MDEEKLVIRAEQIIESARDGLKRHVDTGRTQASNAIEVAKAANSIAVFRNWLRYQKSREEFWRIVEKGSGNDIASQINGVAEEIAQFKLNNEEKVKMLIRFLGYFRRALVAVEHFDQIKAANERL